MCFLVFVVVCSCVWFADLLVAYCVVDAVVTLHCAYVFGGYTGCSSCCVGRFVFDYVGLICCYSWFGWFGFDVLLYYVIWCLIACGRFDFVYNLWYCVGWMRWVWWCGAFLLC